MLEIREFITFTPGGIEVADYTQIQTTLIAKYKEIYGDDIDVADTTADGIFINNIALIINNILQSFSALYSNLNVETASGIYLDNLCRLSNVTRKLATRSTAQLTISATQHTSLSNGTIFVDNRGIEWIYNGPYLAISNNTPHNIIVSCKEYGANLAPAGSITQTLLVSPLIVEQLTDAAVGREVETDAELRARRDQSNGSQGVTVEESLLGALLEVNGVLDAQIIVNNSYETKTVEDTTQILAHDVYIIIRKEENTLVSDEIIGQLIAEKMTPGIKTTHTNVQTDGANGEYTYKIDPYIEMLEQKVYWKNAQPISPTISITIKKIANYTDNTKEAIIKDVIDYLNKLHISKIPTKNDLLITATYADRSAMYNVETITLPTTNTNPNTYYNYTQGVSVDGENDTVTITFNGGTT